MPSTNKEIPNKPGILARFIRDERVRFLAVGGFNTAFGFTMFVVFQASVGHVVGYVGSLYLAHIVASCVAFILYRRVVFDVRGAIFLDFVRFQGVYVVPLLANTLALPLLVSLWGWNVYAAQGIMVVFLTVISYLGHKFFSFRRANVHAINDQP
ncbi:MAG: GtrA family protein [Actinomycetales bacterium]|nr:GtrA family protein [Actinomycetales bacterium]